jgi:amino acid transporter
MGRWALAALMSNSVIGSGIFGLPANVDGLVGTAAPVAYVGAAAGIALIMASFAEVGAQFRESGGIDLYARHAFGRLAGIQMGWMALMVRSCCSGGRSVRITPYAFATPSPGSARMGKSASFSCAKRRFVSRSSTLAMNSAMS